MSNPMTDSTPAVSELRALLGKATSRPWALHPRAETTVLAGDTYSATNAESNMFDSYSRNIANAALIVAAVNALPTLLDEIESLQAALSDARRDAERLRAGIRQVEARIRPFADCGTHDEKWADDLRALLGDAAMSDG